MVFVRVSETYDLSTKVNTMGIIGIHTPSTSMIRNVWGNVYNCHKFFRIHQCDVTMACASMLPADPLQIGESAGDIAPQDMFNPILYRAVSNDSFNRLQSRIYNAYPLQMMYGNSSGTLVRDEIANGESDQNGFSTYYALLSEPDGWRKAMPQSGLDMNGLYPIVYQMVNTYGQTVEPLYNGTSQTPETLVGAPVIDDGSDPYGTQTRRTAKAATFRGPSMRMPALPTYVVAGGSGTGVESQGPVATETPQTYVACIVTPPAKLNKLYYRLKVTWTIEFTGLVSDIDSAQQTLAGIRTAGAYTYGTDYAMQSKMMDKKESTVDVKDADLEPVMVSTR